MFSSTAALSAFLLLPALFGQNTGTDSSTTSNTTTTPSTTSGTTSSTAHGNGTPFTVPTVTGTTCGTAQQNFNRRGSARISRLALLPITFVFASKCTDAYIAACYNACPDLQDCAAYKDQSLQHWATAKISPPSTYNQTSPVVNTTTATTTTTPATTTPSPTNTTTSPVTTASAFARASDASSFGFS
ncbi:uncharacterized protein MELLADRAFT_53368 [Melampsora larici-populina 98AG31]|uniref:Secreted protein n=1 Tax=Melampsora larici-populina (strain 98AG31 / pathotype 3-4-7) TaxID=747676 RepID=F4RYB0_MELLP|nr:uncharacterized protein MELLADRAFT_53368 [Melampsora larici-populina 98AG31]EGG02645.1 secreted protein [Melampsora larici-populina 98AG31]